MRSLALLIAAATILISVGGCTRRPNIVLISIDSLRADHVGAYGYAKPTTPAIDKLAEEGAIFRRTVSTTSWTLPAHVALLTGQPDSVHGVVMPYRRLGRKAVTLADHLSESGYRTVGFYSGPFLHPVFGFDQGFDDYVDCTSYRLGDTLPADGEASAKAIRESHAISHGDVTNPTVLKSFVDALEQTDRRPFFFFVHLWDVHYDFIPPPPYDRMFDANYDGDVTGGQFRHSDLVRPDMAKRDLEHVIALYDGEIRSTDDTIGAMLEALESRGLDDRTLVVVTSDHGEEFFDHGDKGHRNTLYEEVVRVPLVMWYPKVIRPGSVDEVTGIIDIAPTILAVAGVPAMKSAVGVSLEAALVEQPASVSQPRPYLSELRAPPMSAVRVDDKKLIVDHRKDTVAYFDLAEDPLENSPVTEHQQPEVASEIARLKNLIMAMKRRYAQLGNELADVEEAKIDEQTTEELRSLGYLD